MKRYFITILIVFASYLCFANDTLRFDSELAKTIELEFSQEAIDEKAFIVWELNEKWDDFDYTFNQGVVEGNKYRINAAEYKNFANGQGGITVALKTKKKTDPGEVSLTLKVVEVGAGLEFEPSLLNLNWKIDVIMPPPTPWWKILLYIIVPILLLGFISYLFYLYCLTFKRGVIQIIVEGQRPIDIDLKGRRKPSLKVLFENNGLSLNGDVVFGKKCIGYFDKIILLNLEGYKALKADHNFVSPGDAILAGQKVTGLKTEKNDHVTLIFTN